MKQKLVTWTDSPHGTTGLSRIHRELLQAATADPEFMEVFDVASLGIGARTRRDFPWKQYRVSHRELSRNTEGEEYFDALRDFAGEDPFTLVPIAPTTYAIQYYLPEQLIQTSPMLAGLLKNGKVSLEPYLCYEGDGGPSWEPGLDLATRFVVENSRRALLYSQWGFDKARLSKQQSLGWVHHGFNWNAFQLPNQKRWRPSDLNESSPVVGMIATNTARKLWPVALEAIRLLKDRGVDVRFWGHTHAACNAYNLAQLTADLGIEDRVKFTQVNAAFDDSWLARYYRACDVTILPSWSEAFGFPVIESMACGTPCVVGAYGAQTELIPDWARNELIVEPIGKMPWGTPGTLIPFYDSRAWADKIQDALVISSVPGSRDRLQEHARQWDWSRQWPRFRTWFYGGLNVSQSA